MLQIKSMKKYIQRKQLQDKKNNKFTGKKDKKAAI